MSYSVIAPWARVQQAWQENVLLQWDLQGTLVKVENNYQPEPNSSIPRLSGPVIAGMPNLHSHAFQSAMSGLTEYRGQTQDSFGAGAT